MSVYEKILQVQNHDRVKYIKKDLTIRTGKKYKDQKGNWVHITYPGLSHDNVTANVRVAMQEAKLVGVPDIILSSEKIIDWPTKNNPSAKATVVGVNVGMRFVDVEDPTSEVVVRMPATGLDSGDKAYPKAVSMAIKNIYTKTFLIETGENEESRFEVDNQRADLITDDEAEDMLLRLSQIDREEDSFMSFVNNQLGSEYGSIKDMHKIHLKQVKEWLSTAEKKMKKPAVKRASNDQ